MEEYQKVVKSSVVSQMKTDLLDVENVNKYLSRNFDFKEGSFLSSKKNIYPGPIQLKIPSFFERLRSYSNIEFENSKLIYEAYKNLTPEYATDERLWVYLTHVEFWDYMRARTDLRGNKSREYILTHWFVDPVSQQSITRNDIARLWWGAYLTYDKERTDHYELTKQLFSMQDYTRTLIGGFQGRNPAVLHGVLEFVIDNENLFRNSKELKTRFLMKKINRVGGYKILSLPSKDKIKDMLNGFKTEISRQSE